MGILSGLFRGSKIDYASEIEKIRSDVAKILELMEKLGTNKESDVFVQGKKDILSDPDFHPVAKLVILYPAAMEAVNSYIAKLELAKKGDSVAVKYIEETKNEVNKIVESQIKSIDSSVLSQKADKVLLDRDSIFRKCNELLPKDEHDPEQMIPWYEERIKILEDESLDLVTRLSVTNTYDEFVSKYLENLRNASYGDKPSLLRIQEKEVKALNIISVEIKRLKTELEFWKDKKRAYDSAGLTKWLELKRKVRKECDDERALLELSLPKNKKDIFHWKAFYQKRVSRLELDALSPFARLVWVSEKRAQDLVKDYFYMIDRIILGEHYEEQLHDLEIRAETIVKVEASRIHRQYSQLVAAA